MMSHPPEMCTAICLFRDIVIWQARVELWWGGSTQHQLLMVAFWSDTISVRKHLHPLYPPPRESRGAEAVCVAPQRHYLWHCRYGLTESRLAGCQSVGWAPLSWWRSLETQSHSETHPRCETLVFLREENIICSDIWCLWHFVIRTVIQACHWQKRTVSSYVNLNDGSLLPSHCAKHSIWGLLGSLCKKPNSSDQDTRGEL